MSIVHRRPEIVAVVEGKLVRITRRGGIYFLSALKKTNSKGMLTSHVCKLLAAPFQIIPILGLNSVLNCAWDRIVNAEDRALDKFDFAGCISFQPIRPWCLSLPPCFGRA